MLKAFSVIFLSMLSFSAYAQNTGYAPYGKIDRADLELALCDFEKDANALILFEKLLVSNVGQSSIVTKSHVRIKIFNDKGKENANIRIKYNKGNEIQNIEAQTINLNNGNIEFTKIDKKLIHITTIDNTEAEIAFTFPNVKAGSVIEYSYSSFKNGMPGWSFQNDIPTRYSELNISLNNYYPYKFFEMVSQPYVINTPTIKAMANIPSYRNEPFSGAKYDNGYKILYQGSKDWNKHGEELADYFSQSTKYLKDENIIINEAKTLKSSPDKIRFIFNEVKSRIKWTGENNVFPNSTLNAWNKKTGNTADINLILHYLLKKAGIISHPMLVSTRDNGKVNPALQSIYQFNKTILYIEVDDNKRYVLDAAGKYNTYNEIPSDILNGLGFRLDKDHKKYDFVFIEKTSPAVELSSITADITSTGKLQGNAKLSYTSYNKQKILEEYSEYIEKKNIDIFRGDNKDLEISLTGIENHDVDTLPVVLYLDFNLDLTADGDYIYLNPNVFINLRNNPFISETRTTDINFGYNNNYYLNGNFKLPTNYKTDALPPNISITMPDNSITFKRIIAVQEGSVVVSYTIIHKKTMYVKEEYPDLYAFYKKIYQLLNEPIVLKKI